MKPSDDGGEGLLWSPELLFMLLEEIPQGLSDYLALAAVQTLIAADHASFGSGSSMTPTIQDGDLVAVTEVELSDVEVGDVLAIRFRESIVCHRLIDIIEGEGNLLRLKGDGNERPDQILYDASQIMGKVVAVYPLRYLFSSYGYFVPLTAGALLVSSRRRPDLDVNDVLLCLIISLSMVGIIGYRLIGGI